MIKNIKYDFRLCIGDFNFKEIDWENNTTNAGPNHLSTKFLEMVRDTYLIQHVEKATRHRGDNQPSLLDLIFSNEEGMIDNIDHNAPLGNSDHETLDFDFNFGSRQEKHYQKKLCFFKGNYNNIKNKLTEIDWENYLTQEDISDLWKRFANELFKIYEENIPVSKSLPKHFDTPWINDESKAAIIRKRKYWKKYKYSRNPQNKVKYEEAKMEANYIVRKAKYEYEKV